MSKILGVDVGMSGAICYMDNPTSFSIYKMPVEKIEDSTYTRWYNVDEIIKILSSMNKGTKVYLEYQRPMSQQGVVSVFRLGRGFGLLEGILRSRFREVELVDPQSWQKYLSKKYLTKEEINSFKDIHLASLLSDNMGLPYKELYEKRISTKSFKLSKIRTLYALYKSGYIKNFEEKELKDHDKIDSYMIALYGGIISGSFCS